MLRWTPNSRIKNQYLTRVSKKLSPSSSGANLGAWLGGCSCFLSAVDGKDELCCGFLIKLSADAEAKEDLIVWPKNSAQSASKELKMEFMIGIEKLKQVDSSELKDRDLEFACVRAKKAYWITVGFIGFSLKSVGLPRTSMQASRARLFKEYKEVQREKAVDPGIQLGPTETPYEGGVFQLAFSIPEQFPLQPPQVRFLTKIFHPNVHFKGYNCFDGPPEADSPLNCDSGNLLRSGDIRGYQSMARMYARLAASAKKG
ncbi:hypothetical protein GH714_036453 [Hevea brasiliensis]|uniref:UBC core domain-containing protein n=2 Tax=Hevea brasiliensis TaxID=3981 RepID=A0A6A6KDH3_HEVBR|nr:hypothetical protein GH714_036453 [Hevea brasiliensis]